MAPTGTPDKRKKPTSADKSATYFEPEHAPDTSSLTTMTAAQSVAGCPLFKLPPELRNRIYEYAVAVDPENTPHYLGSPDTIKITVEHGIPEPDLLFTCQTIRREAIGIFYTTQDVDVIIDDFDSTPLLVWKRKQTSASKRYKLDLPTCSVVMDGGRSLKNLDNWLFRVHQNLLCDFDSEDWFEKCVRECYVRRGEADMIFGMLDITRRLRDKPWNVVNTMFSFFRDALREMDNTWWDRDESDYWW